MSHRFAVVVVVRVVVVDFSVSAAFAVALEFGRLLDTVALRADAAAATARRPRPRTLYRTPGVANAAHPACNWTV